MSDEVRDSYIYWCFDNVCRGRDISGGVMHDDAMKQQKGRPVIWREEDYIVNDMKEVKGQTK